MKSCWELRIMNFHYSLYEKVILPATFDQFQNNPSRKYSMISYLNVDKQPADRWRINDSPR
jgi:hypothetical protein